MYYLVIKTDIGTLDLSEFELFYRTREEAEKMAELAWKAKFVEQVSIQKK